MTIATHLFALSHLCAVGAVLVACGGSTVSSSRDSGAEGSKGSGSGSARPSDAGTDGTKGSGSGSDSGGGTQTTCGGDHLISDN